MGATNNQKTILNAINYIKRNYDYSYISHLEQYDFTIAKELMTEAVVYDILLKLAKKNLDIDYNFYQIQEMYSLICTNSNQNKESTLFDKMLSLYIRIPVMFNNQKFNTLFVAFDDKQLVYEYYDYLINGIGISNSQNLNEENLKSIIEYVIRARQYYADDRALLASAINLIQRDNLFDYMYGIADIKPLVERKLTEDRKACGVYDVDAEKLAILEEKLKQIEQAQSSLLKAINSGEETMLKLDKLIASVKENTPRITNGALKRLSNNAAGIVDGELTRIEDKAATIISEFDESYERLLNERRRAVNDHVNAAIEEIKRTCLEEKGELSVTSKDIIASVNDEVERINKIADLTIARIQNQSTNNGGHHTIGQRINSTIARIQNQSTNNGQKIDSTEANNSKLTSNQTASTTSPIAVPNIILSEDELMQEESIPLSERYSFSTRYGQIKRAMEKDMQENGTIYHEKFEDVLKIIMEGRAPYLYGPSGCGKSYMIQSQLAKLLGVNVITNGYVMYEQDIIGYNSAGNGSYVPSNFYRCFKYGNIIFLDELDNGIANATVVLNKFLDPNNESYTFPDGVETKKHPNFRIITAGNTNGNGRTYAHNTRQKMDESVLQRLTPIRIDYDNRIEKAILRSYPAWYDFMVNFRKAIEKGKDNAAESSTMGTFTTRDAETLRKYLDDGVFDTDKILEYLFIGTKDRDELSRIVQNMAGHSSSFESSRILTMFKEKTNAARR